MVRNNFGGNRAKKQARKNNTGSGAGNYSNNKLRLPNVDEPDEKFAIITKILGNGQLEVKCIDNKPRLCIIRNKFRGKGNIQMNTWLLVGVRSWEVVSKNKHGENKLEKCDLLEIYDKSDVDKLKERCNVDFSPLITDQDIKTAECSIHITDEIENSGENEVLPQPGPGEHIDTSIINDDDDIIDIDEI